MDYRRSNFSLIFFILSFLLGLVLKVSFKSYSEFISEMCFLLSAMFLILFTFKALLDGDFKNFKRLRFNFKISKLLGLIGGIMAIIQFWDYIFDQSISMYLIIGIGVLVLLNSFFDLKYNKELLEVE